MTKPDFAAEERMLHEFERRDRATTEGVKQMLRDEGRPDLADSLARRVRDIDSGVHGARATWHSISDAQRRVLLLAEGGHRRRLQRAAGLTTYDVAVGDPVRASGSMRAGIRVATVRNLAARGLLDWTGGAFDPEASAVLTERARFVLKHGRPKPGTHFEGYRP